MNRTGIFPAVLAVLLWACSDGVKDAGTHQAEPGMQYANGFHIESHAQYQILHVRDPWQGSRGNHFRYVLAGHDVTLPDSLSDLPVIRVPVKRLVCMSTTHVAMITSLGQSGSIVGISGSEYISDPMIRRRIREGLVRDVGADQTLNYELLIALQPDVIVAYGVSGEVSGMVNRMEDFGIPVILNGDYLETEPRGKLEWVRFMATLHQEEALADSIFRQAESRYLELRRMASNRDVSPTVMTGLPWKGSWYIPGGQSFAAAFIRDAGGSFIWEASPGREALPMSLEAVFSKAAKADIWINCGSAESLEDIEQTDRRLTRFQPYFTSQVYNNTARLNPEGGNDFWESGVMHPHIILADLVNIFHPDLLPGYEPVYYSRLK